MASQDLKDQVRVIQLMTQQGYAQETIEAAAAAMRGGNATWVAKLLLEHPPHPGPG